MILKPCRGGCGTDLLDPDAPFQMFGVCLPCLAATETDQSRPEYPKPLRTCRRGNRLPKPSSWGSGDFDRNGALRLTYIKCLGKGTMLDPHHFEVNGVPRKDVHEVTLEREPDSSIDIFDPFPLRIADSPCRFVLSVNGNPVLGEWELIEQARNLHYLYRDGILTVYAPDLAQRINP